MSRASAQKCGGVQKKITANSHQAGASSRPVAAAQPTNGGTAPAAPPMTIFWGVDRLSQTVYTKTKNSRPQSDSTAARTFTAATSNTNDAAARARPNTRT